MSLMYGVFHVMTTYCPEKALYYGKEMEGDLL